MKEEIVITGAGVVSAIGIGKTETLASLLAGRTGIAPVQVSPNLPDLPAGKVKLSDAELHQLLGLDEEQMLTRTVLMGRLALQEALEDAGISADRIPEIPFVSGTSVGGMDLREKYHRCNKMEDRMYSTIATYYFGEDTRMIAQPFGAFASLSTISTACSSATNAIIRGANMLRCGLADIVVVGGSDCLTRFHLNGFEKLMVIDHQLCRPFDKNRAGLNLGEGAAYLVMETASSARKRGAACYGLLSGYGNACDAYHQTASSEDGIGPVLSMQKALKMAGLRPEDIQYINAHGTGTLNNDESESRAVKHVFGDHYPSISSTKAFTGHTTGASGSIEAVFCLLALQHQFLPVNLNWNEPMEQGVIPVTDNRPHQPIEHVLSNAFGFGGNDSSIVLSQTR